MATDDRAILVGISRYPTLGARNSSLDLQAPDRDVEAVRNWLIDPNGGDVPERNVDSILWSAGGDLSEPGQGMVERALVRLQDLAQANPEGYSVGRRLYIYMSGHGFSASPERACLFTADARSDWGRNVHATGWLSWLRDAGLFREIVLWMDCCMDGVGFTPGEPDLRKVTSTAAAGPSFVAFAAPRPLRAVERADEAGAWHGVFTSVLLEGLEGAAVDANGRVTGRSLGDWLRHALAGRLSPDDVANVRIAKEPMIVRDDADLVFGRGVTPRTYPVTLRFIANATGRNARLWYGSPPAVIRSFAAVAEGQKLILRTGLYAVDIPEIRLRHGFAVTGPTDIDVADRGPEILPAAMDAMFRLRVETPADGGHAIGVSDARLASADTANGSLDVRLPFGLYKIRVSTGRSLREQVILLDTDLPPIDPALIAQPSAAVSPLPGTAAASPFQAGVAEATRSAALGDEGPGTAVITVLARTFGGAGRDEAPWRNDIRVVDASGSMVAEFAGVQRDGKDLCAAAYARVAPGTYYLRYYAGGQAVEQAVVAADGWSLDATLLFRRPVQGGVDGADGEVPRVSLLMRSMAAGIADPARDERAEAARLALVDERDILSGPLAQTLLADFTDPMTGLMAGHLLLLANARGTRDLGPMSRLLRRLASMVGNRHPDLIALRVAAGGRDASGVSAVSAPPMFALSWQPLVRAGLVPVDVWRRVQAGSTLAPYLAWAVDDVSQASIRQDLAGALMRAAEALGLSRAAVKQLTAVARGAASLASLPETRTVVSDVVGRFSPVVLGSLVQSWAAPALPGAEPVVAATDGVLDGMYRALAAPGNGKANPLRASAAEPDAQSAGSLFGDFLSIPAAPSPVAASAVREKAEKPYAPTAAGLLGGLFQSYVPYVSTAEPNFSLLWGALEVKAKELGIPPSAISDLLGGFLGSSHK